LGVIEVAGEDLVAVMRELALALGVVILEFQKFNEVALARDLRLEGCQEVGLVVGGNDDRVIGQRDPGWAVQRVVQGAGGEDLGGLQSGVRGGQDGGDIRLAGQCAPVEIVLVILGQYAIDRLGVAFEVQFRHAHPTGLVEDQMSGTEQIELCCLGLAQAIAVDDVIEDSLGLPGFLHEAADGPVQHVVLGAELTAVLIPGLEQHAQHVLESPAAALLGAIADDVQTHYFNNAVVKPENLYEYDAIYQLIRTTGRELAGGVNDAIRTHTDLDFVQLPHPNNLEAVRNYTEQYEYDLSGNIKVVKHRFQSQAGVGGGWTRHYHYAFEDVPGNRTNRLTSTSQPGDPDAGPYTGTYGYDAYGNMTRMPHLAAMDWNFMDQLRRVELGGGGTAHYIYGLGGQRLRKVIERNGNLKLEWIFLGAVMIFRRRRRDSNELRLERWTVHISDNTGHIAQVDTKTRDDDNDDPANPLNVALIRYQYANHLGSAVLETDEDGNPISYEEYHPYGTTAYRSSKPGFDLSLKRYRFSGKERDEETGLYYFGARYYTPWLGRWISIDPAGFVKGFNLFRYCSNNPAMFHDPHGMDDVPVRGRHLGANASWGTIQENVPQGYRIRGGY
jgi:RHS repeat-associated protein